MVKILIVEDEPSALRHLCMLVEQKCIGFEIAGTADNGQEGLEKARLLQPDVLITDIKMPGMDGIKLVTLVKEELPAVYSVIISGYQDFEYAKGALKSGVVDYLLKPVNAAQLSELLYSIKIKVDEQYRMERMAILNGLAAGNTVDPWRIQKYLPFRRFQSAILRANGLPSRFSVKQHSSANTMNSHILSLFDTAGDERTWAIPGRDEMEVVFFHTSDIQGGQSFESVVAMAAGALKGSYHNIAFSSEFGSLQDIRKTVAWLHRVLDNNTIIGVSQEFHEAGTMKEKMDTGGGDPGSGDPALWNRLNFFLSNGQHKELKNEIIKLFSEWEKDRRTQLWVENLLRQILYCVKKYSVEDAVQLQELEFLLDEALYYSSSYGELMANTWELIDKLINRTENRSQKVDNPDFFHSIERYIEKNIAESLSLQSVCLVFGISQTYLSRLFRKYKMMSFNEYLTNTRMKVAKELITRHPDMHLKDVAEAVGYGDQFYFSRVFRSVMGIPPSEFLTACKNE